MRWGCRWGASYSNFYLGNVGAVAQGPHWCFCLTAHTDPRPLSCPTVTACVRPRALPQLSTLLLSCGGGTGPVPPSPREPLHSRVSPVRDDVTAHAVPSSLPHFLFIYLKGRVGEAGLPSAGSLPRWPPSGSPTGVFHCLPRCISRELQQKWSSRVSSWRSDRMLASWMAALPAVPRGRPHVSFISNTVCDVNTFRVSRPTVW